MHVEGCQAAAAAASVAGPMHGIATGRINGLAKRSGIALARKHSPDCTSLLWQSGRETVVVQGTVSMHGWEVSRARGGDGLGGGG